ncbi:RES family NAD+ phosphorylase [Qipengyuania marisflavi]|uniref:RES domain-containing protein n=1 Tax=Qipengyuania marisflavi TaxID=2486356 RepID=A0A5S3PA00_9SPHN|nr:RES family NAD+ phosphorylase [Qipengyuania marisflavi]TMM50339.1 RES domain-containing protein [Qipengyuania marisflavi]
MRLWRLSRAPFMALDGSGPERHGARYSSPGLPVVNFASEAGLAVLVAQRYLPADRADYPGDLRLGWTEIDAAAERIPDCADEAAIREWVDEWLLSCRSLLAAIASRVLPEGDIVLMNPRHADAERVAPLTSRPFDFGACLHRPPMLDTYRSNS